MDIEIDRVFNNRCLCFGVEFHWGSFLGIEIYFLSYNISITFKEPAPESIRKIESYSDFNGIPHWKSREWWDR